jgi:hypothetical protein
MTEKLHQVKIKKVLGPTQTGTAVLLGNEEKTFVMFIGIYEGAAIIRVARWDYNESSESDDQCVGKLGDHKSLLQQPWPNSRSWPTINPSHLHRLRCWSGSERGSLPPFDPDRWG